MATTATQNVFASLHPPLPQPLTDIQIIQLAQQLDHHQYSSQFITSTSTKPIPLPPWLLSESSHQTLLSYLHSRATASPSTSFAVSEYVSALISLSYLNSSLSSLLPSLLQSYISLFTSHKIPHDRLSLSTIQLFSAHLDAIHVSNLPSIIDLITSYTPEITDSEDAQLLILLPKCLELIRTANEIEKSDDYVNSVVDKLIMCEWSKVLLVKMVEVIRDFSFIEKWKRREFLEKVFDRMKNVDLQDLPGLIYQLLVLASKGYSKKEVIEAIVMHFGDKVPGKGLTVKQVEGTVLLHFNFAVKQDPSLGQEVLGLVKTNFRAFNHFTVAVLLSVARVRRFSESSIGVLKGALFSAYKDCKLAKDCRWLPHDLKDEYLQIAQVMEKSIIRAANESNYGREHIVPSILRFAFGLLEGVEEGSNKELCKSDGLVGIEELGCQILQNLFEVHDMARKEIIEQCKLRILSLKPEQALSIIRLLGHIIRSHPYQMLDHVAHLKELLDYFTFIDAKISSQLVSALLPLTKFSRDLQDYTILVLRKAMFRREDLVRFSATNSIINLMLAEKQFKSDGLFQESTSQASCSQQAEIRCLTGDGLFHELSGLLQRCLYQQEKVRNALYHGLVKLVLADPFVAGAVFELLLPHFLRFYREDAEVQLDITHCVKLDHGKVHIEEPLDSLLSCISWILLLQPHGKADHQPESWASFGFSLTQENEAGRTFSGESFFNALSNIRTFLRNTDLEGLLGKTQDTGSTPLEEEKRRCAAFLLLGISEVLLNVTVTELQNATDAKKVELENELFAFVEIHEFLEKYTCTSRQVTGIRRGAVHSMASDTFDKPDSSSSKLSRERIPLFPTSSICWLLQIAPVMWKSDFSSGSMTSQNHSQLSSSKAFVRLSKIISFVLNACLHQLTSFLCVGRDDPLKMLIYGEIKSLGPPLLKLIWWLISVSNSRTDQKKKEVKGRKGVDDKKEHINFALICLKKLIALSFRSLGFGSLIEDMVSISEIEDAPRDVLDSACENECVLADGVDDQNTRFKEMFIKNHMQPLLLELLKLCFFREVEIVCDIVMMIGDQMAAKRRNLVGAWALHVCKNNNVQNPKVAKRMVSLAVSLSLPPNDLTIAEDMAAELVKVVGSETNEQLERSETYNVINKNSHAVIASSILQLVESNIIEMEWIIAKLKTNSTITQRGIALDQNGKGAPGLALEEALYFRAEAFVKVLSSFVLMDLKDPQAEQLLKLATKFYKDLARTSKLLIAPRGWKQALPSLKYQNLVEITCKQLTAPLYNFMAQMQKNQQEGRNPKIRGMVNKIKRENKCIPDLIFQIEDYEKNLIQLSKATKVNLLRHAKRSTSRDFKILDPKDFVREEEAPNNGTDDKNSTATENESSAESGDEEGNGVDNMPPSPDSDVPLGAEDSGSDKAGPSNAKGSKRSRIIEDSSDEEIATGQSLEF